MNKAAPKGLINSITLTPPELTEFVQFYESREAVNKRAFGELMQKGLVRPPGNADHLTELGHAVLALLLQGREVL